ncbi:MAG: hypothetical protein PSV35_04445, partial [bacterium]|nr:hypothetical protein [bacterium]
FTLDNQTSDKRLHIQYINKLKQLYKKYKKKSSFGVESLALLVDAIAYYPSVIDKSDELANHCRSNSKNTYKQLGINLLTPILSNKHYPDHPGLLHTYIHLTEQNVEDPLGLIAAKKLPLFSQKRVAHYTHMANHIYWRRGMYDKAIQANLAAIAIDQYDFKHHQIGLDTYYYEYHYLHSHHFLSVLGVLTNNDEMALHYSKAIKNLMHNNRLTRLKDYRDIFLSLEHLVLARFNHWQKVLDLKIPQESSELAILFINFTRDLAYLHLGQNTAFEKLYKQIKNTHYSGQNLIDLQDLIISYLDASQLNLNKASLAAIEAVFSRSHVSSIEEKMKNMGIPLWLFPHQLFLSDAAIERLDLKAAKQYYLLFQKIYPKSTLGYYATKT